MPAKLERCVSDVMTKKMDAHMKENGKEPDEATKKKMRASAFAICQAQMKKGE